MALKKKVSVPTKVLVVDAENSTRGTRQEAVPEQSPAIPTTGAATIVPAEGEQMRSSQVARTLQHTVAKTPRNSKCPATVEHPQKSDQGMSRGKKSSKQLLHQLVDELEDPEPEQEVPQPNFEATFDDGNTPNAGDDTEMEEGRESEAEGSEEQSEGEEQEDAQLPKPVEQDDLTEQEEEEPADEAIQDVEA